MRRGLFLICTLALSSACGCITGGAADAPGNAKPAVSATAGSDTAVPAARVKPDWQTYMVKALNDAGSDAVEAYGLFSDGGWADAGQVMVIVNKAKPTRLLVVATGKKTVDTDRPLTDAEWATLKAALDSSKSLESVENTAFDALTFELAHATAKGVDRRLYYQGAGKKPHPDHEALINAFQALKKK